MSALPHDITRILISDRFIATHIFSIFPDSIFLDKDFRIAGMSENIYNSLGYAVGSFSGQPLAMLQAPGNFEQQAREQLSKGYFDNLNTSFLSSDLKPVNYSISGFYLGLLTDSNGFVVLRCVLKEEVAGMEQKFKDAKTHVDNFVYRAAHDLRGPLATMLGLVNLLKIRVDNSEVDRFADMIEMHGRQLDERLHQIVYLSTIGEELSTPTYRFSFSKLETELRKVIEKNAFVDFLELSVVAPKPIVTGYNEIHLHSILSNILQYVLSLPSSGTESSIRLSAKETYNGLTIAVKAKGFLTDPEIAANMRDLDIGRYSQLLQSPKFINLFAAQKIAMQSKAFISLDQLQSDCEQVTVWMPRMTQENDLVNQ
jgi:signal transduction histidine kinase